MAESPRAPASPRQRPCAVVVDSGIDAGHPLLRGCVVGVGRRFDAAGDAGPDRGDRLGHGTAVAIAIAAQCPDCELLPFAVFDQRPDCPFERVLQALQAATALVPPPDVVNLSLGTTSLRFREPLLQCLAAAAARRIRITAPATFHGLPCDPGSLPGADGVIGDGNLPRALPILHEAPGRRFWLASPTPPPGADGVRMPRARGDSIAVAHVTALLLRQARAGR